MTTVGRHGAAPDPEAKPLGSWVAHQAERARALLDRVPGARRLMAELTRIELVDRSLALGAQALLALLPFVVVLAAFTPADLGTSVVSQLREAMGLNGATMEPVADVVTQGGSIGADGGALGLVVALVSATSFSRALARMYARAFEVHGERGSGRVVTSVLWLPGWLVYMVTVALLARWPADAPGGGLGPLVVGTLVQLGFWWWSAHYLLLGRVSWSQLLPAALVTTVAATAMIGCSPLVMPPYTRASVEQFGGFGLVLAAASWLVAFAGVLVASSLIGRLLAERQAWHRAVAHWLRVLHQGVVT